MERILYRERKRKNIQRIQADSGSQIAVALKKQVDARKRQAELKVET